MALYKKLPMQEAEEGMVYISALSRLEQKDIERSFARLFSSEEGKRVLAWLQVMTFHRSGGASTSDQQLRVMEGQRTLMASILRMIDRGKNNSSF